MSRRYRSQRVFSQENLDQRLRAGCVLHLAGGGSGLTWEDKSGYGYHGTLTNFGSSHNQWSLNRTGLRHSLRYDGSDDNVDCGNSTVLNPSAITACVWVYFTSLANAYNCVFCRIQDTTHFYQLLVKSTGKLAPYMYASSAINYDGTGTYTLTTGVWFHLAFTYSSGNGLKVYVNGLLDGSVAANGALSSNTGTNVWGKDTNTAGRLFNGLMSDARIYDHVLSTAEIALLADPQFISVVGRRRYFLTAPVVTAKPWYYYAQQQAAT